MNNYNDRKNRLRRSMLFIDSSRPSLLINPYIYKPDSIIFDLEDAVSENEKDNARILLYEALTTINYGPCEKIVRINGLTTSHWQEDLEVSIAANCDGIRIPKCEEKEEVLEVVDEITRIEKRLGKKDETIVMAAIESPKGVINSFEIASSSERMFGLALSGGDLRRQLQVKPTLEGIELQYARGQIIMSARAAGIQCFDTVFTNLDNHDLFNKEAVLAKQMGFDGKSLIHPKQIKLIHEIYKPEVNDVRYAERLIYAMKDAEKDGKGVLIVDGQMVDIAFVPGAYKLLQLASKYGMYSGDLI